MIGVWQGDADTRLASLHIHGALNSITRTVWRREFLGGMNSGLQVAPQRSRLRHSLQAAGSGSKDDLVPGMRVIRWFGSHSNRFEATADSLTREVSTAWSWDIGLGRSLRSWELEISVLASSPYGRYDYF